MTRRDELERLRDAVKAGHYPTQAEWHDVFPDTPNDDGYPRSMMAVQANVGWVDAALALKNEVLPDEGWNVEWVAKYPSLAFKPAAFVASVGWGTRHAAYADTPARALLLATLAALIAQEGQE